MKRELQLRMNEKLYPPRFKFVVQSDSEDFFQRSRTVIVKFHGIVKTDNSNLPPYKIVILTTGLYILAHFMASKLLYCVL